MSKSSDKRFVLVSISDSVREEDIRSLFAGVGITRIRQLAIGNYPQAKISKHFASIILGEAVQPYYILMFFEKIRQAKLQSYPVLMFSMFLNQPAEVNILFDHVCKLLGVSEVAELRRAEVIMDALAEFYKKLRRAGIANLTRILSDVTNQGNIDLTSAEILINQAAATKLAELKQKSKQSKKKKPKKKKKNSLVIISTPMGGQPGWKRK